LKQITVLLIISCFFLNHNIFSQTIHPSTYDRRAVIVPVGQSRTFMLTNQKGLFYYGETGQPNTSRYHGLNYLTLEFLEDYIIEISGVMLSRSEAEVHLMGNKLIRYFKNLAIEEEISMADSLPILMVKLRLKQKTSLAIAPLISGSNEKQDFTIDWSTSDKILYITRNQHLARNDDNSYPQWIGICTYPEGEYATTGIEYKSKLVQKNVFCPGKINIYAETEALILFVIGNNKNGVLNNRNVMLENLNIEIKKQKSQIEGIRQAQMYYNNNQAGLLVSLFECK